MDLFSHLRTKSLVGLAGLALAAGMVATTPAALAAPAAPAALAPLSASAAPMHGRLQAIDDDDDEGFGVGGLIGGLALGALAGGAGGYYGPRYSYGPGYSYGPAYYRRCYLARQHFWTRWGWRWRTVRVCN